MKRKVYSISYSRTIAAFILVLWGGLSIPKIIEVNYDTYLQVNRRPDFLVFFIVLIVILSILGLLLLYILLFKVLKSLLIKDVMVLGEEEIIVNAYTSSPLIIKYTDVIRIEQKPHFLQNHLFIEVNNNGQYKKRNWISRKFFNLPNNKVVFVVDLSMVNETKKNIESDIKKVLGSSSCEMEDSN